MADWTIKQLRERLGLTQSGFAHALQVETGIPVKRPTVTGWENGHSRPTVDVAYGMVRMAERVGVKGFRLEHALPENGST